MNASKEVNISNCFKWERYCIISKAIVSPTQVCAVIVEVQKVHYFGRNILITSASLTVTF